MNIISVMDRACTTLNDEGLFNPGDDLCKARAAVAELIAFVKDCADGWPECDAGGCRNRAIALLARVGGAK